MWPRPIAAIPLLVAMGAERVCHFGKLILRVRFPPHPRSESFRSSNLRRPGEPTRRIRVRPIDGGRIRFVVRNSLASYERDAEPCRVPAESDESRSLAPVMSLRFPECDGDDAG